jgi:fumarate reductase subunit C
MLMHIHAISRGETAYREFVAWCRHPVVLVLNLVTLFFVVFHAATWFNWPRRRWWSRWAGSVPPVAIIAGNYAAWAGVSLVAWLVLGG